MTESLPLLPEAPSPRRCRCGRPVPKGRLIEGWGSGCAVEHGVAPAPTPRVTTARQEGESLFDLLRVDAHRVGGNPGMEECPELRGMGDAVNELVTWLDGVLDARGGEAAAINQRRPGPWRIDPGYDGEPSGATAILDAHGQLVAAVRGDVPADYIAQFDPTRILNDVAADRALLRLADALDYSADCEAGTYAQDLWRTLATKYATWPGYQKKWFPEVRRG